MKSPRLILASASPRRRELLLQAGWECETEPAHVDETPRPGEAPETYVRRLARDKAWTVARRHGHETCLVIGADTTVVCGGEILGKPEDREEARRMLRRLSGSRHRVLTGLSLVRTGEPAERSGVCTTKVWFAPLSEAEIDAYIATGEPWDKAGGYAIQGAAAKFIPRIDGSWSNVVGLPLHLLREWLEEWKVAAEGTAATDLRP